MNYARNTTKRDLALFVGVPPQTGTATLQVYIADVNDNPPRVTEEPIFTVPAGVQPGSVVAKFYVDDLDMGTTGTPAITSKCIQSGCDLFSLEQGTGNDTPQCLIDTDQIYCFISKFMCEGLTMYL